MALSYTTAIDRDVRSVAAASRLPTFAHLLLPMTSVVALLAIGLSYAGTAHTAGLRWPGGVTPAVNLNEVGDAAALERALEPRFANAADRRLAAQALFDFVRARRDADGDLPNVGTLAEARISAQQIEANRQATAFADRLRQARAESRAPGAAPPDAIPVLTSESLAAIKPSLIVRTRAAMARSVAAWTAIYLAAFYLVFAAWLLRGLRGDMWLLAGVHLLTALGFALLLSRVDPLRDTLLVVRYTTGVVAGLAMMALVSFVDFRKAAFLKLSSLPLAAALLLSLLLILFGDGPGRSGARVNLGPVQPIEAIRLLLAFFLAGYFAERWELLRQLRSGTIADRRIPMWLHVPRPEYVLPVVIGVGAALIFFVLQRDLGPALYLACVFLAMYAVARARVAMAIAGAALLAAGFAVGYRLDVSSTLTARVLMWQSPWDNAVRGGDQLAQSIWAVSTGGWSGTGLGFGDTRYLPAGHTDLVLAAIGEELGLIGLLAVAAIFICITARGLRIALRAADDYGFFLATAVTLFLAVPVVLMAAGVFGLMPLTGIVTPFLSYGGSAMVANLVAVGVLMAIDSHGSRQIDAAPFRRPVLSLGTTLAAAAVVLLAVMASMATVQADQLVVRPHLGRQADGVRRYQYNPRVLDVVRTIPRGTVYDRRGLALATGDPAVLRRLRADYAKVGLTIDDTICATAGERCYPLASAAFHVIGDATTRANWSATNSSYVERDADARLRGFDDHATLVEADGATAALTIRRDYRELLPLVRHRYDANHPDVRAVLDRPRDVRLTLDAPLQTRVAGILAKYASRSTTGRAAAIVIDTSTGNLLAAASYPVPATIDGAADADAPTDAWLDRARYGLYPPGSTFKLVTAAAALDKGLDNGSLGYTCAYLPNGRVGARIPGWNRPVRDDVLDKTAHGTLRMHDGLVHSCNAYFAQLAVTLGPRALMETAARAGISTAPDASVRRLRDTLPQAGYGQGDVVASPLRMARVAAALANGGRLKDVSWDAAAPPAAGARLVSADAAALLARYMRDSVLTGTGRTLRQHPLRIAGKTGTAEVAGAASHSWFVGFAPFDGAASKIAFAVIVENAGYGAAAAAPLSGDIVTAAAELGLIQ
jgi:cell division protein FtsW (lipid II flippase)